MLKEKKSAIIQILFVSLGRINPGEWYVHEDARRATVECQCTEKQRAGS